MRAFELTRKAGPGRLLESRCSGLGPHLGGFGSGTHVAAVRAVQPAFVGYQLLDKGVAGGVKASVEFLVSGCVALNDAINSGPRR